MFKITVFAVALFHLALVSISHAQNIEGLKARAIGPAVMGGRISAVDAVESNPHIIFIGAASGGVWKTLNGGQTWKPIFDENDTISVGALVINQQNPDIVWVGTGEGNLRNSAMVGRGIYRSLDGGVTWKDLGLKESEHINQIVLDPRDSNTAYVMALGNLWGASEQRGVFKTIDGGESWDKILYVNDSTGGHEMILDRANPDHLIVSMWQFKRSTHDFISGGTGSGLFESFDGGASFTEITEKRGFLKGPLGKIGLAQSKSHPEVIYAMTEAEKSALLKSIDGGKSWTVINDDERIMPRAFYYGDIVVDPADPNRIYKLEVVTNVSDDGGKTFEMLFPDNILHGDHHALWVNPNNPNHMIDGNDGGIAISYDKGKNWDFTANVPLGQFYHIATDNEYPYNIYGGLQDNGSWSGPSEVWEIGGIRNHHWKWWLYMDGFEVLPDPENVSFGYGMGQNGWLMRWNRETGEERIIQPVKTTDQSANLRFNWNAGFAINPHDANIIYLGSQYVHRSMDKGDSWEIISEDLTTNNPDQQKQAESGGLTRDNTGAENYNTISSIVPSGLNENIIWVGTDDGRMHITSDGGESWVDITGNIPRDARGAYINHIEASSYDESVAFVAMNDHRRNNWRPLLYKVENNGKKWNALATEQIDGFTHVIKQDHINPDLLFAGAEFGLHISRDGGKNWVKHISGIPPVAVHDLAIQSQEDDLVIGTHGRGIFIIDDYSILRQDLTFDDEPKIIGITDAQHYQKSAPMGPLRPGFAEYSADNEPYGAVISWSVKKALNTQLIIRDNENTIVRTMEIEGTSGINRIVWDLQTNGYRSYPNRDGDEPSLMGPEVPPGVYRAEIGGSSQRFSVLKDPRYTLDEEDYQVRYDFMKQVFDQHGQLVDLMTEIHITQNTIKTALNNAEEKLKAMDLSDDKRMVLENLKNDLTVNHDILYRFEARLSGKSDVAAMERLSTTVFWGRWLMSSNFGRPTQNDHDRYVTIQSKLDLLKSDVENFYTENAELLFSQISELSKM